MSSIMKTTTISKYLSYILRHNPADIGLQLDAFGWAKISDLIERSDPNLGLTREAIEKVVRENDKQRFRIDETGTRIKANQGHSFSVANDFEIREPPEWLYHGTAERNVPSILKDGILKMKRHHVHLSQDVATAKSVGSRYGKPVVFRIDCQRMYQDGQVFYLSENRVWLSDYIPPEYLEPLD